jgi:hypothetical protein
MTGSTRISGDILRSTIAAPFFLEAAIGETGQ